MSEFYKKSLRENYKKKRESLTTKDIESYSKLLTNTFFKLANWKEYQNFHVFLTAHHLKEFDTQYLIQKLWEEKKNVVSSIFIENDNYQHAIITPHTIYKNNHLNIPEPIDYLLTDLKNIDCMIVPMLIFDEEKHRVGYGKGIYDSFLANIPMTCEKIGFCFFSPVKKIFDIHVKDKKLDQIWYLNEFGVQSIL